MVPASPEKSAGKSVLARKRLRHNLSQEAVARRTGMSTSTLGKLEALSTEKPSVYYYAALARVYRCAIEDLLEENWDSRLPRKAGTGSRS